MPLDGYSGGDGGASADRPQVRLGKGTPFRGEAVKLPGKVEAEDFDRGGENVGYHDLDAANQGKAYRFDEGVDISGAPGSYIVGWRQTGEWLSYTVDVTDAGMYSIGVRVVGASSDTASFHVELSGSKTRPFFSTNDGKWADIAQSGVWLAAGRQELKVVNDQTPGGGNGFCGNLDFIVVERER
jgi:hypothetical protein